MEHKNHKDNNGLIEIKRLATNEDYYNMVFKKTERIASAVFYILSYIETNHHASVHYNHLSTRAMSLHESVIASLNAFDYEVKDAVVPVQHALVALDSALTLASAARVIGGDMVASLAAEIDGVLRYVRNHYNTQSPAIAAPVRSTTTSATVPAARPRRPRPNIPKNDFSSDAVLVYSDLNDRATRIKTVLEAKPEATIKDLSDIITDVSSKTIQRELNSLIEKGEVIRQGERRWSRYSVVK